MTGDSNGAIDALKKRIKMPKKKVILRICSDIYITPTNKRKGFFFDEIKNNEKVRRW